jgi:cytoskeletal protein CcmA (bactofilin family)
MFGKKKAASHQSLIAVGTCIEGNINSRTALRIDGESFGDIRAVTTTAASWW